MNIEKAIKWMEEAVQDTTDSFEQCSPELQAELTEQKEVFELAITALHSLRPTQMSVSRESLTVEQLREVPHGKIKNSTLQDICDRANEIAYPPAHIDRSKWTAKNITDQHPVDQFICSECGAIFEDFSLCKIDEDSGDKEYYEYELKFCPACGRAVTEEAWTELERRMTK